MALEQVLSDRDSEDEVDDDIADLEDRRVWSKYIYSSTVSWNSRLDIQLFELILVLTSGRCWMILLM